MGKQAIGSYSVLKLAYETAYDTDPADLSTGGFLIPFNTCGLKSTQNMTSSKTIRGRRDPVEPTPGNIDCSGDAVVPVGATAFGHILKMMFGAPTTTAVTGKTGFNSHVFKVAEEQPSAVIEKGSPDINVFMKYNGVKASQLSLTVGGDGELTSTVSLMGTKETVAATTMCASPTSLTVDKFDNLMASLKVGGETVADVTQLSLQIDGGMDGDTYAIGSKGYRTAVNEGILTISGQLTAMFMDKKYIDLAENATTTSLELALTNGDYSLTFELPELKFARNTPSIDGPAGVKQQLNYNAFYSAAAEATSMVVTLVNKTASY